ncbi:hypothetical protein [Microtetraspora fusca]|uniref:HTH iclR-type domain-containing protein n=1 Tax=Microtetraspora fusca TaxID=1997 RepID=A0ABW6V602_MICFU|nr:hypothetical protein [Microtetraspora fusca]
MSRTATGRKPHRRGGDAPGQAAEVPRPLADVQSVHDDDMRVYETVAALYVDRRVATATEIARLADLPEEFVRHSLDVLVADGWLVRRQGAYLVGPHDWGLEY